MTQDEIREALAAAGGTNAYIDAADGETFILDGAFTLQQLVAIGDVARKALGLTADFAKLLRYQKISVGNQEHLNVPTGSEWYATDRNGAHGFGSDPVEAVLACQKMMASVPNGVAR